MRRSISTKLAIVFFGITLVAIGALYLYVAPGLSSRLLGDRLAKLAAAARQESGQIEATIGSPAQQRFVVAKIDSAALASGDRVTLLLVARTRQGLELSATGADSAKPGTAGPLSYAIALRAARSGLLATGTAHAPAGVETAQAALPVRYQRRVADVIVYSAPTADIQHSVAIVRDQILEAGGIALLLALVGGYLIARALARRVKRLEVAAEKVAAGDFEHQIAIGSPDELGQLAVAFNAMQRQLAQLESAREKFIATASHELRTPIFSLGGFVELLGDEELDPETRRRFLDQVADQVERLRKLSVDLLDLSKLESGSLQLRPEQVDLGELTRSVSSEFEPALAAHDSHLELRLAQRSIEVQCDPVRVAQIMRILIDNALTHTPAGTRIVVTAARTDGHARLAVRDDGSGIPAEVLSRIFEPFYTGDDIQGSGLGLAIASELAERMSGRLGVNSIPGQTTFTLEIPD